MFRQNRVDGLLLVMPRIEGLRSPYDKTVGGLHHLGRMLDKIRLMQAGKLPGDFHRNYGLSIGLDGFLCGFLNVEFAQVEEQVKSGATDAAVAEWIFGRGLRPNRMQAQVWNECARKFGWNDRVTTYLKAIKQEQGLEHLPHCTSFDIIEATEEREPPAMRV